MTPDLAAIEEHVAHEIATRTGVRVSDETLRIWFAERVNS